MFPQSTTARLAVFVCEFIVCFSVEQQRQRHLNWSKSHPNEPIVVRRAPVRAAATQRNGRPLLSNKLPASHTMSAAPVRPVLGRPPVQQRQFASAAARIPQRPTAASRLMNAHIAAPQTNSLEAYPALPSSNSSKSKRKTQKPKQPPKPQPKATGPIVFKTKKSQSQKQKKKNKQKKAAAAASAQASSSPSGSPSPRPMTAPASAPPQRVPSKPQGPPPKPSNTSAFPALGPAMYRSTSSSGRHSQARAGGAGAGAQWVSGASASTRSVSVVKPFPAKCPDSQVQQCVL